MNSIKIIAPKTKKPSTFREKLDLFYDLEEKFFDTKFGFWLWLRYYNVNKFIREKIICTINPRQRWLTKQIPNTWCDKTWLIPHVLYASVIHFVEVEKCFEVTDWPASGLAEQEKQLKEIYQWAKSGRNEFIKKIDDAFPNPESCWPIDKNGRTSCFDNAWELEKEFEQYDDMCLTWIVKNREILWT